ncbi:MAG TPA: fumarylacetoacetate hydrolase family protein [Rudaea sp.]|jgi:fumarylpyruvate hydrolase|uniref:fumarylacetoacetate hydrolase family protein n=1 Tax=Rudaea sp. TaxID=2136325 RepID=UPI002F930319
MKHAFTPAPQASVAIAGSDERFPVHRIYCIGRNYADHAKEMGMPVERGTPLFFCKPADAVVEDGATIPYPSATNDLHHEVEMVVALHSGGTNIAEGDALAHVFGYGVGIDLTRRDLQAALKAKGSPWDIAKAFDRSAPVSAIHRSSEIGHPAHAQLSLNVNGTQRQRSDIGEMLFNVAQIIHELSKLFELKAGDLIFTGTPAGVAALKPGDAWHAKLEGIAVLRGQIG